MNLYFKLKNFEMIAKILVIGVPVTIGIVAYTYLVISDKIHDHKLNKAFKKLKKLGYISAKYGKRFWYTVSDTGEVLSIIDLDKFIDSNYRIKKYFKAEDKKIVNTTYQEYKEIRNKDENTYYCCLDKGYVFTGKDCFSSTFYLNDQRGKLH